MRVYHQEQIGGLFYFINQRNILPSEIVVTKRTFVNIYVWMNFLVYFCLQ